MIKRFATFAVASAAIIALVAVLFGLIFGSPADHRAIRISALIAYGVQLFGFVVVLLVRTTNIFAAWGLGMLLRLVTLAVFAFLVVRGMRLPPESAQLSQRKPCGRAAARLPGNASDRSPRLPERSARQPAPSPATRHCSAWL